TMEKKGIATGLYAIHPLTQEKVAIWVANFVLMEIQHFIDECRNMKMAEAEMATMEKKGIATGLYAIHPLTQEKVAIWVANFVLME
ncbi:hypothetical protein, partial [Escherichia coli]|uniref:hypothetical protein n=1 Tax=Escherichia coli TaxID=562 RepID=UPI000BDBABF9